MSNTDNTLSTMTKHPLRPLALKAQGMTGADIEYIVRQARQKARRHKRPLTWRDIAEGISGTHTPVSTDELWRMAVHEAGHAVIQHILKVGRPITLSIEKSAGLGLWIKNHKLLPLEENCTHQLAVMLAGRAAEEIVLGTISIGSAMEEGSDLCNATTLALQMETIFGFSKTHPLLFRDGITRKDLIFEDHPLTSQINARLQQAYQTACNGLIRYMLAHKKLAEALVKYGVLEGSDITALLDEAIGRVMREFL